MADIQGGKYKATFLQEFALKKNGPHALNLTNTQILWLRWLNDICKFCFIYWINNYNVQERLVNQNRT